MDAVCWLRGGCADVVVIGVPGEAAASPTVTGAPKKGAACKVVIKTVTWTG